MKKFPSFLIGIFGILTLLVLSGFTTWPQKQSMIGVRTHQIHSSPIQTSAVPIGSKEPYMANRFTKISRQRIAGFTGKPTEFIEILPTGQLWLKAANDQILTSAQLTEAELLTLYGLLQAESLINEKVTCQGVEAPDGGSVHIVVEKAGKTTTFHMRTGCEIPDPLIQLNKFLNDVQRKYLKQ